MYYSDLARDVYRADGYSEGYAIWKGHVCPTTESQFLSAGPYRIRFSALKHFGNASNPNDYEIYRTPSFNLIY